MEEPETIWFDSDPLPWIIRRNRNLKGQDEYQIGVYIYICISFVGLHNQIFKWFGPQVSVLSGHPPQHSIEWFCLDKASKIIKSIHLSIAARFPHNILPTVAIQFLSGSTQIPYGQILLIMLLVLIEECFYKGPLLHTLVVV